MTKRERAAALIKNFPDLRQEDIARCMAQMPHHILFRHDRSECRCNYCGSTLTAQTHFEYLSELAHDTKTCCPECGAEGYALCDSYNYSNTVGRGAKILWSSRRARVTSAMHTVSASASGSTGRSAVLLSRITITPRHSATSSHRDLPTATVETAMDIMTRS